jgi:hypothetical protein
LFAKEIERACAFLGMSTPPPDQQLVAMLAIGAIIAGDDDLTTLVALTRAREAHGGTYSPTYGASLADREQFAKRHGHYALLAFRKTVKRN